MCPEEMLLDLAPVAAISGRPCLGRQCSEKSADLSVGCLGYPESRSLLSLRHARGFLQGKDLLPVKANEDVEFGGQFATMVL
jgi:hypothetical protein